MVVVDAGSRSTWQIRLVANVSKMTKYVCVCTSTAALDVGQTEATSGLERGRSWDLLDFDLRRGVERDRLISLFWNQIFKTEF